MAVVVAGTIAAALVNSDIQVAPPPPIEEVVPAMNPGYVWAPGYWAWHGDRHTWVQGRSMAERNGYSWQADRWERSGFAYYQEPGRWERETGHDR